jgi:hypothetical protein
MDASDMLDVIHYFFEEDTLRFATGEHAEASSKFRTSLYEMYGLSYKYAVSATSSSSSGGRKYVGKDEDYSFDASVPGVKNNTVKPYMPPTQIDPDAADPFGGILDAPIG